MKILVTGAAGYIGSVVTEELVAAGYEVLALDNLKHGHRRAVHPDAHFAEGDLLDRGGLKGIFATNAIDAVVHLAAEAQIDESARNPGLFYRVNVSGGLNLLDAMVEAGTRHLIFSSTAAVYGEPDHVPITEDAPCAPVNPYGDSKLAFERALFFYAEAHGIRFSIFRYFNACGATARCGEFHLPETHLIANLLGAALGNRPRINLYGTDYDTPDGTCLRDYVHVADIARAHLLALKKIDGLPNEVYNLGMGRACSNREVIETVQRVTGRRIEISACARRPGDPARLEASPDKAHSKLGWEPRYTTLGRMVATAWVWRQQHPQGYVE